MVATGEVLRVVAAGNFLSDIQVNTIASLVAGGLTYIAATVWNVRLPTFAGLLFWRRFVKDVVILISEMEAEYDPKLRRGEQPPLTPLGDALALGQFLRFLKIRHRRASHRVVSAQNSSTFDRIRHNNLLVIGGPKYNHGAESILIELDDILPYQFRRLRPRENVRLPVDLEMKRFVGIDKTKRTPFVLNPERDRDYACLVVAANPFNEDSLVLVAAGLSSISTLAAAECIHKIPRRLWYRLRFRHVGFQIIVSCTSTDIVRATNIRIESIKEVKRL